MPDEVTVSEGLGLVRAMRLMTGDVATMNTANTAGSPDTAESLDTAGSPDTAESLDTAGSPDTAESLDTAGSPDRVGTAGLSGAAIVTGAGGGIGAAIAARLATEGMSLVLADRDAASLARAASRLPAGTVCEVVIGDVGEPAHHDELVSAAEDLGGLSLSVLNAGVYLPGLSWDLPLEQWELHVRVNYWGVVHGVRAAVPAMISRGGGHIVGMASGAGLVATPALAPYVSTKHAVVGLMESLYHELARVAPEVHASVVCPGNVRTPMASNSLTAAGIDDETLSGISAAVAHVVRAGNDAGKDPSTVADAIVAAVRDHRFWVLPQPEIAWAASDRIRRLAEGEPPVDLLG